ncbi:MAG: hypothetical protein R6V22_07935, partial [Rhodohalobacter sp.]|uniref:hypothetical protein n=1 Tax=Rhodohalobacter sp. TaxID=1974210 RepID=UPI0039762DAF
TGDVPWMGNGGISLNSGADVPELPDHYSTRFRNLIKQMMSTDPASRPKSGDLKKITQKYLETGHWPEIKVQKANPPKVGVGRKTQKIESAQTPQQSGSGSAKTKKGVQSPKKVKLSRSGTDSKTVWLIAAVLLIVVVSAGGFYLMTENRAEAQRLAEQEANQQVVAELVQQAESAKSDDDLEGAFGYYEQALEIMPEDENVNQLLTETRSEIERREEQAAQLVAAEAERQREQAEQEEREAEQARLAEEQRQRELAERRSRPDITADPIAGTIRLDSGFDDSGFNGAPHIRSFDVSANIDLETVDYSGFTTSPPTVHLEFQAGEFPLVIYSRTYLDTDLVMLIYGPNGEWYYNDDYSETYPGIEFENPESGTYMIWVGNNENDDSRATIYITEDDDSDDSSSNEESPDINAMPIGGDITLEAGFSPDPYTQSIALSGSYDLSEMGYSGFVSIEPTFDFYYTPGTYPLTIRAESDTDTVILINAPNGEWYYSDDLEGMNPGVVFDDPEDGLYNIWIGTYSNESGSATLVITEI